MQSRSEAGLDFEELGAQWIRALRGRRSQAAFSRRLGYASSVVHRWERKEAWPTAARFLQICERAGHDVGLAFQKFLRRNTGWLEGREATSPQGVAALLRRLAGKVKIGTLAELSGFSRYTVSRWLSGKTEPKLPDFLRVVEAASRRSLDFVSTFVDPVSLPAARAHWERLQALRTAAYEESWSHAVLRALELEEYAAIPSKEVEAWLSRVLGIPNETVRRALRVLEESGQVEREGERWAPQQAMAISTGRDPELMGVLTRAWTEVALERVQRRSPGHYGYSLFSVSRADLQRLRELNLEYVREMQAIIAKSQPTECVGLLCVHLFDLAGEGNALG